MCGGAGVAYSTVSATLRKSAAVECRYDQAEELLLASTVEVPKSVFNSFVFFLVFLIWFLGLVSLGFSYLFPVFSSFSSTFTFPEQLGCKGSSFYFLLVLAQAGPESVARSSSFGVLATNKHVLIVFGEGKNLQG